MAVVNSAILNGQSTVFTGTGQSTVTAPTVNGVTTVTLTNTSSFIGTVTFETSLDNGSTWPAGPVLLTGTMVAGPLTFSFSTPQLTGGAYQTAQHRLNCTAYTSGTMTATSVEAAVPAPVAPVPAYTQATNQIGSQTNDSAPAGVVGEYDFSLMSTVAATGTTFTVVGDSVSKIFTATGHGLVALQAVNVTNSGGGLPTGVAAATNYYVTANSVTANTFQLSDTLAHAAAGTNAIACSTAGTGTQTVHGACYLATTVAADICGLPLAAGDYDVDCLVLPGYGASTSVTSWAIWIAQVGGSAAPTTAANILAQGLTSAQNATANTTNTGGTWATSGTLRISLSAAGYVALAALATFSVSTLQPQALLRARRVR